MDVIGVAMGMVTIPMALLTMAGMAGAIGLLVGGHATIVLCGLVALAGGVALALLFERVSLLLDAQAWATLRRAGRGRGLVVGIVGAVLPMAALLLWQYGCFALIAAPPGAQPLARWLWSYLVATGPWTAFALRVGSDRRTLCGIRAYAGHLGYWLLSALVLVAGTPPELAAFGMILPAILPLAVGALLAVADRDALRNVRI